ncbi:hemin transporter [Corynebacterium frankenforstense DSM 45800]|uniref:nitric oxide dioxygenase n=1 Tax=Corynebacterium frankenforstense DSM 45800 TaxID=1437875 RepID=A0A1L7CQM5_9CORY|nr:globin domain-containing protein [Corynebacterium frankenforstense]APT88128.1 hemin transporter [Corynebacterium frankenforstense DSM 45800]
MHVSDQPTTRAHLTPEHEEIVSATLPAVGENIGTIAETFYHRMFSAHPELLRDTFNRGNQHSGAQQKALAASVATFATMLVDPEAPDPVTMLSRIAHKHVSVGIVEDQYPIVRKHLFDAIREVLGADTFTAEVEEAWDEVYWLMARVLIDHESALYSSDGVTPGEVFREVTVTGVEKLSETVSAFELSGELSSPLPGQYTSVGVVLDDGARQLRQYSIIDGDAGHYRIAVERDGEVSQHLQDHVAVGDTVQATLAAGDLTLDESTEAPVVLISSGIGSTPMVGILTHLARTGSDRQVLVLHADDSRETHAQYGQTRAALEQLGHGELRTFYRDAGERIDVAAEVPAGADVYLCGGTGFLQSLRAALAELQGEAAPVAVHFELFSPNDWLA